MAFATVLFYNLLFVIKLNIQNEETYAVGQGNHIRVPTGMFRLRKEWSSKMYKCEHKISFVVGQSCCQRAIATGTYFVLFIFQLIVYIVSLFVLGKWVLLTHPTVNKWKWERTYKIIKQKQKATVIWEDDCCFRAWKGSTKTRKFLGLNSISRWNLDLACCRTNLSNPLFCSIWAFEQVFRCRFWTNSWKVAAPVM